MNVDQAIKLVLDLRNDLEDELLIEALDMSIDALENEKSKKRCYRYGGLEPENCNKCETCLRPEDLQWNEGDI